MTENNVVSNNAVSNSVSFNKEGVISKKILETDTIVRVFCFIFDSGIPGDLCVMDRLVPANTAISVIQDHEVQENMGNFPSYEIYDEKGRQHILHWFEGKITWGKTIGD